MKKMIKSLAVLSMMITAIVLASCNKPEAVPTFSDKFVTVTIAPPAASGTDVATPDGGSRLTIAEWEKGEIIPLYKVFEDEGGNWAAIEVEFGCTDPSTDTFTSINPLPTGVSSADELNLALYHCELDSPSDISDGNAIFNFDTKVSQNLKDAIAMAAVKDADGKFEMKVINNVVNIRNNTSADIEALWKGYHKTGVYNYIVDMQFSANVNNGTVAYKGMTGENVEDKIFTDNSFNLTLNADNYLPICPGSTEQYSKLGLSAKGDGRNAASIIPFMDMAAIATGGGVLYTAASIGGGALKGVFSVAADKKVCFSKGNLWYNGADAWSFETHQYDSSPSVSGPYDASHLSHFFWSKFASMASAEVFMYDGDTEGDILFTNATATTPGPDFTVIGETGVWRTLAKEEWQYIFNVATLRMKYGKPCYSESGTGITIEDKTYCGVFLYPDDYNGEILSSGAMTWNQINEAGIVFLPATGNRRGDSYVYIGRTEAYGAYWSSYSDNNSKHSVFSVGSSSDGYNFCFQDERSFGYNIRLVKDVE